MSAAYDFVLLINMAGPMNVSDDSKFVLSSLVKRPIQVEYIPLCNKKFKVN